MPDWNKLIAKADAVALDLKEIATNAKFAADSAKALVDMHEAARADALEAANVAPWQPAPVKDDGEAVALVRRLSTWRKAAVGCEKEPISRIALDAHAYLARLDAAKGGAT